MQKKLIVVLNDEAIELFIPEVLIAYQMLKCLQVFPLTKLIMDVPGTPFKSLSLWVGRWVYKKKMRLPPQAA